MKIGLISDTHGLLRPEALQALAGVEHIIHAGDIGGPEVIERLRGIAPVDAVRGNNDKGAWAANLPLCLALEFDGVGIHVIHDVSEITGAAGFLGTRVIQALLADPPGLSRVSQIVAADRARCSIRRPDDWSRCSRKE